MPYRWRSALGVLALFMLACDLPQEVPEPDGPNFVMWGLNFCPECEKRAAVETEQVLISEALEYHINASCMNDALDEPGAYDWLSGQVGAAQIGIDMDVSSKPEYDYAKAYWVEPSLRYQYWGYAIWLGAEYVTPHADFKDLANSLVHETAHEFGWLDTAEDEILVRAIANLCTY